MKHEPFTTDNIALVRAWRNVVDTRTYEDDSPNLPESMPFDCTHTGRWLATLDAATARAVAAEKRVGEMRAVLLDCRDSVERDVPPDERDESLTDEYREKLIARIEAVTKRIEAATKGTT